jgi:hypothetical protein
MIGPEPTFTSGTAEEAAAQQKTAGKQLVDVLNTKLNLVADKMLHELSAHGMPPQFQLAVAGLMLQKLCGVAKDPRPLHAGAEILLETAHAIQDELERGAQDHV